MKNRGKVIVIEDNEEWQEELKECLEDAGFFVEVASNLEEGLQKIRNEIFHFATIDLQLDEDNLNPSEFEGWQILDEIIKHRTDDRMPTMIITGFNEEYAELSEIKKKKGTFFLPKKKFEKKQFVETVINAVEKLDLRFFDDKRDKQRKG